MAVRSASRSASRAAAGRAAGTARNAKWTVPPVVVRQVRNGIVESVHRGDIVEVDAAGRMLHLLGDPDRIVNLRSAMKPFGADRRCSGPAAAASSTSRARSWRS